MPKMKTHKGAAQRLSVTGTGKLRRMKRGSSHLRRNKSKAVRGTYDAKQPVHPSDEKRLKRLVPTLAK
ncbi:MAG: 50S ribosomal protein L35 [SAR202 cluster bacterium]|nr:50S ribosomal protein L35 [SAR202 cluster bacterium]